MASLVVCPAERVHSQTLFGRRKAGGVVVDASFQWLKMLADPINLDASGKVGTGNRLASCISNDGPFFAKVFSQSSERNSKDVFLWA
jgi:hypothetical protein